MCDLEIEQARGIRKRVPVLPAFLLFLDCWRLAPAEVLEMFFHDVRHAFRLLRREPGFTLAAVLTLTLGVGANVAVFAVVNAVLLRPLPYPDAERLVLLQHRDRRTSLTKEFIAIGDYVDLRNGQQAFESLAAYGSRRVVVSTNDEPFDATALLATPELLQTLRFTPALGRGLEATDGAEKAPPVVILGYDAWQTYFAGDATVIGRSIRIASGTGQVVGIAPRGFRFPVNGKTDLILPLSVPVQAPAQRKSDWTFTIARLKPGVSLERATADLAAVSRQMEQAYPQQNQGSEYFPVSLRDALVGDTKPALLMLLAAVGLVLLIACVNVANLLVARSLGRQQEMALRVALGAGRRQIVMQLLAESVALATLSGAAAILFGYWAVPALVRLVPTTVNLPQIATVGLDGTVLAFTAGVTLLTAVAFSLYSAAGIRIDRPVDSLMSRGRVSSSRAARRATSTLVVVEIALALVLLTGAGLILRSFAKLLSVDPGFTIARVLTLEMSVPADRYKEAAALGAFYARAVDAVRNLPGVQAAGTAAVTPLTGNNWTVGFERPERPSPAGDRPPDVGWQSASGGYFPALQIPLESGRLFSDADTPTSPAVVIVSDAIQQKFFEGQNAVGRKIKLGRDQATIVGVVGNIRRAALTDEPRADLYFAAEQAPQASTQLFVRTSNDPANLVPSLRTTLRSIEPGIVLREIATMEDVARESVQVTRLALWLLGLFAMTALALAAVGIYGVMSYAVRQRMREIGTRVALGASRGSILWLVLGQGVRMAALGIFMGLAVAWAAGRVLRGLLYSTSTADPAVLVGAAVVLFATAILACYLPARRATRVDPAKTLAT